MPDTSMKHALDQARALMQPPEPRRERVWPTLAAAGFFAVSALVFAAAAILAPPVSTSSAVATSLHRAG